ncbi:hypothetical protein AQV86_06080 [Nanohaloarchaea archaeon SG9]|nr:hypothetical protein AQV86_06080 [Nanohaloarchaea archaeon SG9]
MTLKASRKVPDGKMIKLELEKENKKIENAEIRGDFFLEPPEKLEELERKLEGLETEAEKEEVVEKLEEVDVDMIGFSAEDVFEAFREAVEGERDE